jgi:hypothetical protein
MWIGLLLIAAAASYRIAMPFVDGLPNFAPLMAIAFCGAVYLPRRIAFAIPLAALLLSDLFLNWHYGAGLVSADMLGSYACYIAAGCLGLWVAGRRRWAFLLGGSLACSALFYLVTNSAAWFTNPAYAKSAAGWLQALTTGIPGYPPTWTFFTTSVISDLLFTALFAVCMEWSFRRRRAVAGAAVAC